MLTTENIAIAWRYAERLFFERYSHKMLQTKVSQNGVNKQLVQLFKIEASLPYSAWKKACEISHRRGIATSMWILSSDGLIKQKLGFQ